MKYSPTGVCFGPKSPAGRAVLPGCGTFEKYGLAGESKPLEMSLLMFQPLLILATIEMERTQVSLPLGNQHTEYKFRVGVLPICALTVKGQSIELMA